MRRWDITAAVAFAVCVVGLALQVAALVTGWFWVARAFDVWLVAVVAALMLMTMRVRRGYRIARRQMLAAREEYEQATRQLGQQYDQAVGWAQAWATTHGADSPPINGEAT